MRLTMKPDKHTVAASKQLSWLLRHGAGEAKVTLDAEGWATIESVLHALAMSRELFDRAVDTNEKKRFEIAGDRVRACQGHSEGVSGVTTESLEQSWDKLSTFEGLVWHGTHVGAIEGIAIEGVRPISRTHVHLAQSLDATVGKRANVDFMLGVSLEALAQSGQSIWTSANGVVLVRAVSVAAIVAVEAFSKVGQTKLAWAKSLFSIR
jgi:putative RNA 2'-phosphotransferase